MLTKRKFLTGTILTLGGLVVPKVFYSIPRIVAPQNLAESTYYWWKTKNSLYKGPITMKHMQEMFDRVERAIHSKPDIIITTSGVYKVLGVI